MPTTFKEVLERIKPLAEIDSQHKSTSDSVLSLIEECGEFCRAVKAEDRIFGNLHKTPGEDGSTGEAVDIIVMGLALYITRRQPTILEADLESEQLCSWIMRKLAKWARHQQQHLDYRGEPINVEG